MSEDEIFVTIVSVVLGLVSWAVTLVRLGTFRAPSSSGPGKMALGLAYPVSVVICFIVLRTMASYDVVNDVRYLFLYSMMGATWVGLFGRMAVPGISMRDDLLERGNTSAGYALAGFVVGVGLCFTGGNVGDGPGWWVVVFSALLATGALSVSWWVINGYTKVADHITIDRDPAIALRMAGYFIGAGLILGRAVAGDWESAGSTVRDFLRHMWPMVVLMTVAIVCESKAKPAYGSEVDMTGRGIIPALGYLIGGMLGAAITGPIK